MKFPSLDTAGPGEHGGVSLFNYLEALASKFAASSFEAWVKCEIIRIDTSTAGHVYFTLIEKSENSTTVAQAGGTLWKSRVASVISKFESTTRTKLTTNTKVLLKVKGTLHPNFGFKLNILDIDPRFTLGDVEAQKQAIRDKLRKEGIWASNKLLEPPTDFFNVAVIASATSAGIGDFRVLAENLQSRRICKFNYLDAVVQGEKAAQSLLSALTKAFEAHRKLEFDAVVILRGGGASSDLLAFNDEQLVRAVSTSPIPVIAAVGHERDRNLIDEVAWKSCSTPTKAAELIKDIIVARYHEFRELMEFIVNSSSAILSHRKDALRIQLDPIRESPLRVRGIERRLETGREIIVAGFQEVLSSVRQDCAAFYLDISRTPSFVVKVCAESVTEKAGQVYFHAPRVLSRSKELISGSIELISVPTAASMHVYRARLFSAGNVIEQCSFGTTLGCEAALDRLLAELGARIYHSKVFAKSKLDGVIQNILVMDPKKTLQRGFALVRNHETGRVIGTYKGAASTEKLKIEFCDGSLIVENRNKGE